MCTFLVHGNADDLLQALFPQNDAGHLTFGFGAISALPCNTSDLLEDTSDLLEDVVNFRDYIMEGFVFYAIRAEPCDRGLRLIIGKRGMNRDQYIAPNICHFMKSGGYKISEELTA